MSDLDKTKAALAYLMDQLVYSDSYGVHGSDFAACRLCNGGGAPGVPLVHEKSCPIACYGDVAQEWWDEREDERKEAADEIASLKASEADLFAKLAEAAADLDEALKQLASAGKAAERVCWFDWTGNDPDACKAIDDLRTSLSDEQSEPSGSHEQFSCLCGIGPEPCPGPDGKALCALKTEQHKQERRSDRLPSSD